MMNDWHLRFTKEQRLLIEEAKETVPRIMAELKSLEDKAKTCSSWGPLVDGKFGLSEHGMQIVFGCYRMMMTIQDHVKDARIQLLFLNELTQEWKTQTPEPAPLKECEWCGSDCDCNK